MSDSGIREFCQIALGRNFTTPDRVKEVVSECVRARRSGREMPVGEIFMTHRYLDRRQVAEIMKEIYGPESVVAVEVEEASRADEPSAARAAERHSPPVADPAFSILTPSTAALPGPANGSAASAPSAAAPPAAAESPPSGRMAPAGPFSGRLPGVRARPGPPVPRVVWGAVLGILAVAVLAFVFAGRFAPGPEPAASALPDSRPEVVLSRELGRQIAVERADWADADGKGRVVLLVHYVLAQGTRLTDMVRRVRVTAVHDRAAIETFEVEVRMNFDDLKALSERVDVPLLGPGGVLRENPSGVLVLPLDYPALADAVILSETY